MRTPRIHESNLMEELGHVNHVITDKTGTLTKNEMVFYGVSDTRGAQFVSTSSEL